MTADPRDEKITSLLEQHPEGLSIEQIAKQLKTSTITCVRILDRLTTQGDITRRSVGSTKLHYHPKHNPFKKNFDR